MSTLSKNFIEVLDGRTSLRVPLAAAADEVFVAVYCNRRIRGKLAVLANGICLRHTFIMDKGK